MLSDENPVLKTRLELKISQANLVASLSTRSSNNNKNTNSLDDAAKWRSLLTQAEEINKRLGRLREEALNWSKTQVKLEDNNMTMKIGRLSITNPNQSSDTENSQKPSVKFKDSNTGTQTTTLTTTNSSILLTYKIPSKSKNFQLVVFANKTVLKVSEFAEVDDFSFRLSMQLVDKHGTPLNSATLPIESFRLKRVEANSNTHNQKQFIVILLQNNFGNNPKSLLLFNSNIELVSRVEFNCQLVVGLFMTDSVVFLLNKNAPTMKYSYKDGELRLAGIIPHQKSLSSSSVVVGVVHGNGNSNKDEHEDEKFFYMEWDKSRVRIVSEKAINNDGSSSSSSSSFVVDLQGDTNESSWLAKVDSAGRLHLLNKHTFKLDVYGIDGVQGLSSQQQKRFVESFGNRLKAVDSFFAFNNSNYSLVDLKNRSVYFVSL